MHNAAKKPPVQPAATVVQQPTPWARPGVKPSLVPPPAAGSNLARLAQRQEDFGSYQLAHVNTRVIAIILDGVLYGGISAVTFGLAAAALGPKAVAQFGSALSIGLFCAYWLIPMVNCGQTLGKKIMKIRVVSENGGGELSRLQVFLRECVGRPLSAITIIGYVMVRFTEKQQTLHDKIASTRVVSLK